MANWELPNGGTIRRIETVGDIKYIGISDIGLETDSTEWVVQKIETIGTTQLLTYAQGAWDDYLTLTYK